jgi:flavin reductase (DIM6/NTAB) family NADH-FMN oxidoreductase RutF
MTSLSSPLETGTLRDSFRGVMASVCTPVSVVTALDGELPHGTTVSAFASLSMDPEMVMVALDQRSELLSVIRRTRTFGLNVLGSKQSELAMRFAGKGGVAKFAEVPWELSMGVPHIPGAAGFVACDVADLIVGGDHIVVFGAVTATHVGTTGPLTYHGRIFGTHIALDHVSI